MQKFTDQELEQVTGGAAYSTDQAINRALGNAGLRIDQVKDLKCEGGVVSFVFNHSRYTYKMDMASGSILSSQKMQF